MLWVAVRYARTESLFGHRDRYVLPGTWPATLHAVYGEFEVTIEIETGVVTGRFPRRALGLVLEWAALHRDELLESWTLARQKQPLKRIAPLE